MIVVSRPASSFGSPAIGLYRPPRRFFPGPAGAHPAGTAGAVAAAVIGTVPCWRSSHIFWPVGRSAFACAFSSVGQYAPLTRGIFKFIIAFRFGSVVILVLVIFVDAVASIITTARVGVGLMVVDLLLSRWCCLLEGLVFKEWLTSSHKMWTLGEAVGLHTAERSPRRMIVKWRWRRREELWLFEASGRLRSGRLRSGRLHRLDERLISFEELWMLGDAVGRRDGRSEGGAVLVVRVLRRFSHFSVGVLDGGIAGI